MSEKELSLEEGLFDKIPADDKEFYIHKAVAYSIENLETGELLGMRFKE